MYRKFDHNFRYLTINRDLDQNIEDILQNV